MAKTDQKSPGTDLAVIRKAGGLSAERWPNERLQAVWDLYANNADNLYQVAEFCSVAQRHGLDPAAGEVWLIQTKQGPKIYTGRDGLIRSASRYDNFGGLDSGVVYEKDEFRILRRSVDGEPAVEIEHKIAGFDRGKIVGAYAVVYGKERGATVITRHMNRYRHLHSKFNWQQYPDDMIENRAIVAGLRRQVPIGGLLVEGEEIDDEAWLEENVGRSTEQELDRVEAELGIGHPPKEEGEEEQEAQVIQGVPVNEGRPEATEIERMQKKLSELLDRHKIPRRAVRAWALASDAIPEDVGEWDGSHYLVLINAIRESGGNEVLIEYARYLMGVDDSLGYAERMEIENDLTSGLEPEGIRKLITRLEERST